MSIWMLQELMVSVRKWSLENWEYRIKTWSHRIRYHVKNQIFPAILMQLFLSTVTYGKSPNFVLINVDDLGWSDVGFNGAEFYETPNIDRLARQGMIFSDAYASAPSCLPSRASLISGMYNPRHHMYQASGRSQGDIRRMKLLTPINPGNWAKLGITTPPRDIFRIETQTLPASTVSIAEMLVSGGYATARLGKWDISRRQLEGFQLSQKLGANGPGRKSPEDTFLIGEKGAEFIKKNRKRSFFLYLSYWDVHTPHVAREDLIEKYVAKKQADREKYGKYKAKYAAQIEAVDTSVGGILDTLDEFKLAKKTLVIFTSDNGSLVVAPNSPFRGRKNQIWEGGIRVPTCMRWPSVIPAGTRSATPIIQVDILPTFAQLAGLPLPLGQPVDGKSLKPLLADGNALEDRAIFWHVPLYKIEGKKVIAQPSSAIRRGAWKLIEFLERGGGA